jgi:lysophospholipase L1-like esterase
VTADIRIAFFGDSFTAGVGDESALGWVGRVVARARATGWDVTAYNLGVRRETVPEVQRRLVAEARPRLRNGDVVGLVLSAGINDTTVESGRRRAGVAETLTALDRVVESATAAGWSLLVVGPALVGDDEQNQRIGALSGALAQRCAEHGVRYVEVAASLVGDEAWLAELAATDGSHPRSTGYERLSALVWPAFREWLAGLGEHALRPAEEPMRLAPGARH